MRRRHYVVFGVLLAAGFGASLMLITRGEELALIRYRDKEFDAALRAYEARLAAGDFSPALVGALTQLYLQYGNVDAALTIMERFVRTHPSDVTARRELSKYYQYAQRNSQYIQEMEALARIDPSEDTLRRLSEIYNFLAQFDRQIDVLQQIVQRYPGRPQDLIDLAGLQAAQRRVGDAADTLRVFHTRHPEAVTADTMHFLLSVLLDAGERDETVRQARTWLDTNRDPLLAVRIASLLHFKGAPAEGLAILAPFADAALTSPVVLVELTQLETANGLAGRARERLTRLDAAGRLPPTAIEPYLDLLFASGAADAALDVAMRLGVDGQPRFLLVGLVDAALASGRLDLVDRILEGQGEGVLDESPVTRARLALARGNRVAAIELLRPLLDNPATPDQVVVDLAALYLQEAAVDAGLTLIASSRTSRRSPEVDAAWARLAAKAGQEAPVTRWLAGLPAAEPTNDVLDDLFFLAAEKRQRTLAVVAAERRWRRRRDRTTRFELASALAAAGRAVESLPHFRALMPGGPDVESGYVEALSEARANGASVDNELRQYWTRKLVSTPLDTPARNEVLFALLDLNAHETALPALADLARRVGGQWLFAYADAAVKAGRTPDLVALLRAALDASTTTAESEAQLFLLREHGGDAAALPYLRRFAEQRGADWTAAYEEALAALGRRDELVGFWRSRAMRRDLPAADRRSIAFRSLEAGEKELAEAIWLDLAAEAPPDSPDVRQLLFLWGPRPQPAAADWIEARARAASGPERQEWMRRLIEVGLPRRALAAAGGEYSDAYLDAVVAAGDREALARTVAAHVPRAPGVAELRRLANAALALGATASVRTAYEKLLTIAPDDPEALRRLGGLDFAESRMVDAAARLARYLAGGGADPESLFYYGESLAQKGDAAGARVQYERALAVLSHLPNPAFDLRALQALALHRVGRADEAFALFESLLREEPSRAHVRADYVSSLIKSGKRDEARRVLDLP